MSVVLVTGTSTGVGKTVATAAMTVAARSAGRTVAVVKPAQTGVCDGMPTDIEVIRRLARHDDCRELVRLPDPLAPDTAARRAGVALPPMAAVAASVADIASTRDLVLVEGAGGVLVHLDLGGGTLLTLADHMSDLGTSVSFVVVTSLALGTLNHTELTVRAIEGAGHSVAGLVVGSVDPGEALAERCNRGDLPRVTGRAIVAEIPAGAGEWTGERFCDAAPAWFSDTGWAGSPSASS